VHPHSAQAINGHDEPRTIKVLTLFTKNPKKPHYFPCALATLSTFIDNPPLLASA
jgi:hypothetical protein